MRQPIKAELNPEDFDKISITDRKRAKEPAAGHIQFPHPLIKGRMEAFQCFNCRRDFSVPVGSVRVEWDNGTVEMIEIFRPEEQWPLL